MELLHYFASVRTPFLTALFQCFTLFGEELVVIIVLCLLYWCFDKDLAYKVSFGFFLSGLLVQGAKVTFRIDRPWIADPQFEAVERAMETATGYSFPSGHTQGAFALYGTLGLSCSRKWQSALWFLLACGVGVSRLYLGVHTPLDVLGAAVITLLSIFFVHLLFRKNRIHEHTLLVSCILFALSAAVLVYVFTLYHNGVVDAANAADCCKAAGAGLGFAVGYYLEHTYIRFDPKEGGVLWQVCKLAAGFAVALLLKSGLKYVLGRKPAGGQRAVLSGGAVDHCGIPPVFSKTEAQGPACKARVNIRRAAGGEHCGARGNGRAILLKKPACALEKQALPECAPAHAGSLRPAGVTAEKIRGRRGFANAVRTRLSGARIRRHVPEKRGAFQRCAPSAPCRVRRRIPRAARRRAGCGMPFAGAGPPCYSDSTIIL